MYLRVNDRFYWYLVLKGNGASCVVTSMMTMPVHIV
jgi:hypothetical protein